MSSELETRKFTDYGLQSGIIRDVADLGYEHPTPIQDQCIPPALEGKDVIGLAQTGTGKTAAFGLPIIQRVGRKPNISALVLAPTRELAQQIGSALQDLGRSSGVRVAVVVGGVPVNRDYRALRERPNVLVATPGRLNDHIRSGRVSLSQIEILTVDEADRMYDMGFMPQIEEIIRALPRTRQTLMFSATMPGEVEKLARRHLKSPLRIQVGMAAPVSRAEQKLYNVLEMDKMPLLLQLLSRGEGRVLVFARTKHKVDRLARSVGARRHNVARIHGDCNQSQRTAAMSGFRQGKFRILIATDIAARGIDVADIEHVINYDFPRCAEDYIHRIGRTARVAATGLATSFVTHADRQCLNSLERLISAKLALTPFAPPSQPQPAGQSLPQPAAASRRRRWTYRPAKAG